MLVNVIRRKNPGPVMKGYLGELPWLLWPWLRHLLSMFHIDSQSLSYRGSCLDKAPFTGDLDSLLCFLILLLVFSNKGVQGKALLLGKPN